LAGSFGTLLVARLFNGLSPAALALGPMVVVDLFFFHQRARAIGIFTLGVGNHIAPILGGVIGQFLGWRWIFLFTGILNGVSFLLILLCMPETLYTRHYSEARCIPRSFSRLKFQRFPEKKLKWCHFFIPTFKMAIYPSVLFPALYNALQFLFTSLMPTLTIPVIFVEKYGFTTLKVGLTYGIALTVGSALGELAAGMVVDAIVKRELRKRPGHDPIPEKRLKGLWTGAILVPVGILVYGFCVQSHTHWIGPILGMGIGCFGSQIIATICYTYAIDCYRTKASESALLFVFIRQEIAFSTPFYAVPLGERIGYQFESLFLVVVGSVIAFAPMVVLMFRGEKIRKWAGIPPSEETVEMRVESEVA